MAAAVKNGTVERNGRDSKLRGAADPNAQNPAPDVKATPAQVSAIVIPKPDVQTVRVKIVGTAPLIVHAWSAKAIRKMEESQGGRIKPKGPKEPRDPQADFEGAKHQSGEGWEGVPAVAFKAAMVGACRLVEGVSMTLAKRLMFVEGTPLKSGMLSPLVKLQGEPARLRTDTVRLDNGSADMRYRPEYWPWSAELTIRYNAGILSPDMLLNLLETAGAFEGVGEWRPGSPMSATGSFGTFSVAR